MISEEILLKAVNEYGSPLYVYDANKINEQYQKLTSAFEGINSRFFYACKALSNINILKIIEKCGAGLDTVSIGEVHLGLKAGFTPNKIIFTPNSVSFEEIVEAKNLGVHINIDNISILERFGNEFGNTYPICIRVNPHIMAGGNYNISTGHIDSKFGISIHQLRHIERIVKSTNLNVEGLHMHTGSEILDTDVFLRAVEIMYELTEHFPNLKFLDLGSGFKVPYKPEDAHTDLTDLGQKLKESFNDFAKKYNTNLELWFEPGKFLVSECGYFLCKTNIIKQTTATVFAGIDSGFNHLIRPMFYNSYHRISNISNPEGNERIYTVVGNICETDTFAWDRKISEIHEGDVLCFHNAGAYGFEMASHFNTRPRPAEVLFKNNELFLIRKRETLDQILSLQIEIPF